MESEVVLPRGAGEVGSENECEGDFIELKMMRRVKNLIRALWSGVVFPTW